MTKSPDNQTSDAFDFLVEGPDVNYDELIGCEGKIYLDEATQPRADAEYPERGKSIISFQRRGKWIMDNKSVLRRG